MLKDVDVTSLQTQLQALGEHRAAADARELIERLQTQLKLEQTKKAALNFELARLKQWRFGKSSEGFQGSLVCDDYSGYRALFKQEKLNEAGCWAHDRRKFFEAHKLNQSEIAKEALHRIQQ